MTYASVCSGAEAFGPAWHELGLAPVFHAEIEAHASAVLRYHYPTVPNYGDFTQIATPTGPQPNEPVQLLCGGTPCQTYSIAGLREGLDSYKGGLTLEFVRLAQRLNARWLLWENVPGVLSADGGQAFGTFLGTLAECGYGFAYRVLDLQHFGCPQRRKRVFLVAHSGGDWQSCAAVLFESESLCGHPAPGRKAGQEAPSTLGSRTDASGPTSGRLTTDKLEASYAKQNGSLLGAGMLVPEPFTVHGDHSTAMRGNGTAQVAFPTERARCIDATGGYANGQGGTVVMQPAPNSLYQDSEYGIAEYPTAGTLRAGRIPAHQMVVLPNVAYSFKQGAGAQAGSIGYQREIAPTLTGASSGTQQSPAVLLTSEPAIAYMETPWDNQEKRIHDVAKGTAPTLSARSNGGGTVDGWFTGGSIQSAVRRLMPIECERLMGWADGWTKYGINAKGTTYELADGPRYRICGNGWGQPVVTWIANRILLVDALLKPALA